MNPELSLLELLARLGLATVLCAAIGLERETRDQAAGLRTHVLVGLGSTLFTLVSAYGFSDFSHTPQQGAPAPVDPTRISAQIVSGIGFLGAGAIIRQGFTVRGLTTAAALWIVAAIGMAVGAGYYEGAVVSTLLGLGTLVIFRRIRPRLMGKLRTDWVLLEVEVANHKALSKVLALLLAQPQLKMQGMSTESAEGEDPDSEHARAAIELRVPAGFPMLPLLSELQDLKGVYGWSADGFHAPSSAELTD